MGHFFYALDNAWTLAKKSPFSYSINWGSFVSVGGYLDHPYSAQVEWVVLLPDNLQYRTWSNILFCYAVAMSLAEAASILQFFWDSEMNWGVRKKIHYTFDRNSLISMLGLIFIWDLSLFVFSIAEWSPSLSSAFWYTLVKELFTPVSHVIFIWGHNYPGMGSKRRRLTSQLAKVWRPYRY